MAARVLKPAWTTPSPRLKREQDARRRARAEANRNPSIRELYRTPRWRALRRQVLLEEPVCRTRLCGNRSVIVDHVRPHQGDPLLFFNRANLAGRCKRCHDAKTAGFDGGFGNRRRMYPI